ncbi:gag/pol protein [Cucumis melo var. makuwa]|uniref:Gag/pol protein n=1 Tax=Cucumis melo var. makuwa TaxID=1194695 RepID=A0A5D3DRC2_CUCMM|nr:gag/pol protein [Cucumis melo var. makuwa]
MNDVDRDQWIKAMELEIESMFFNSVWTLVDQPNNVKPIGCKWIYKRKRDQAGYLTDIKKWLATQFQMKDLRDAQYVLEIQIVRNRKNRTLAMSQASYIDKMLSRYKMQNFKKGMVSRYQSNPGRDHWTVVKNILKYLRRTKDYMLVYGTKDLILTEYTDSDFQTDKDARKSTSGSIFTLN